MLTITLTNDWSKRLEPELSAPYMLKLRSVLEQKYRSETVYPCKEDLFNALNYTSYDQTKVVILGQDPYHGPKQAHGLSFSVQPGIKPPPSLKNIYKELREDIGCPVPEHGCLEHWAKQGVLLLNTVLTVVEGQPGSHQGLGWERLTDAIIGALNDRERPVVFILWGKHAEQKASVIDSNKHHIMISPHPSPFAARKGFFGSKPFSRTNAFLDSIGSGPIDWCLPVSPSSDRL